MTGKELDVLAHILGRCEKIEDTLNRFGVNDFETFQEDRIYREAVAFSVLQIGELIKKLSLRFRNENDQVPWQEIQRLRNIVVHHYGALDNGMLWNMAHGGIDSLRSFCRQYMASVEEKMPDGDEAWEMEV